MDKRVVQGSLNLVQLLLVGLHLVDELLREIARQDLRDVLRHLLIHLVQNAGFNCEQIVVSESMLRGEAETHLLSAGARRSQLAELAAAMLCTHHGHLLTCYVICYGLHLISST